ncbi:MAG: hypothetical protein F2667_14275 [Actinobacteria bacterium]|nr:hypothetical protein [Actinomycetota bacterium]
MKGRGNRKFDVTAIDGRTVAATEQLVPVLPVFGARAWDPDDLIAELESLRRCSTDDARSEVQDMPWHQIHRCHQAIARAIENREAAKR